MTDEIVTILRDYLSFDLQEKNPSSEDALLKSWMLEMLALCRDADSFEKAKAKIEPRSNQYSSTIDFNKKVPYSSLLLFYIFYKWGKFHEAIIFAKHANEEFEQRGMTHNQAIALWVGALAYKQEKRFEDAQKDISEALGLMEKKLSDCRNFTPMKVRQKNYENICEILRQINDRLKERIPKTVPPGASVRTPPPRPTDEQSGSRGTSTPNHPEPPTGQTGGPGNDEGIPLVTSPTPRIEVNIPIDITLSNLMKSAISSEVEAPVTLRTVNYNEIEAPIDTSAINVNDVKSLASADAASLNVALPAAKSSPHDTELSIQEGEIVEEISLPWLDFIDVAAQADPDGYHLRLDSPQKVPTAISHIIIEDRDCTIHALKKTSARIDRIIKLVASRRYAWIKVVHDSMKNFDPPIEEGDYILYYECNTPPPEASIVVVSETDETKEEERILVKQYSKIDNCLYSYNNEKKYAPRPPCEHCRIVGIVVAVAKPNNPERRNRIGR